MELTGPKETIRRARQLRMSMSLPERLLWAGLRKKQTGLRFRKQHPAGPYVLDFYCDSEKLCVEVDGKSHDFTAGKDRVRDRWLAARGVKTVRVAAEDVLEDVDAVIKYILGEARTPSVSCADTSPRGGGALSSTN